MVLNSKASHTIQEGTEIRDWSPVTEVWQNPPKEVRAEEQKLRKVA